MQQITDAVDDFAGHGWGVALQRRGIREHGWEIMPAARATLYLGSPPCQSFSVAGAGEGRKALDAVLAAVGRGDWRDPEALYRLTETTDPRTALVLVPLARIYANRPEFVALEQVDPAARGMRSLTDPAPTLTSKADRNRWVYERPATTVVADPRLGGPGRSEFVRGGVSRQDRPGSMRLTVEEMALLQSYPPGFVFCGNQGERVTQVGNAVPPLLAGAIIDGFLR